MKNILVTGASGMVGGLVLQRCLHRPDVACVTSLVRKPSGSAHPKLREVVVRDFLDLAAIEGDLKDQDICFYCVGVYTGAVPKEEFRKITVDYAAAFAHGLKRNSPQAIFCFLSGEGADRSGNSRLMFARDKGAAETILSRMDFPRLHCFRPGYIYPVERRREPNALYAILRVLWKPLFSWLAPGMGLDSHQLADAMVTVGFEGGKEILFNNMIKAIAKGSGQAATLQGT